MSRSKTQSEPGSRREKLRWTIIGGLPTNLIHAVTIPQAGRSATYPLLMPLFAQQHTAYPGIDGFLGTRGSLMLDVVFLAMFAVVPVLLFSVYVVRYRRLFWLHKQLQLVTGAVLLVAVLAFEVDMRFITHDWELRADPSPFFNIDNQWGCPAGVSLIVHLFFAVPTLLLWIFVTMQALRRFPNPPQPIAHSRSHMFWGRLAAIGMLMTAFTGWIFYYLAFIAS
jgi:putative membrane protein